MRNINTIIFDMDGVVVDGMPYHIRAWREALSTVGMQITDLEIYLMEGMTGRETINELTNKYNKSFSAELVEKVLNLKQKIFNDIFTVDLMKGAKELLLELYRLDYKLALVTGTRLDVVKRVLQAGLDNIFKVVVTGEMVARGKPDPEPYLKAVNELKSNRDDCLVIENAPAGIASAKGAGLRCFAVETSLSEEYLKGADKIFQNMDELFSFLIKA